MDLDALYAQGARCGHIEGKGGNLHGYESLESLAHAAAWANVGTHNDRHYSYWKAGYKRGHGLAAEGSALPSDLADAPLP